MTKITRLKNILPVLLLVLHVSCSKTPGAEESGITYFPGDTWEKIALKEQDWSTAKLAAAYEFAKGLNMSAAVAVYRGKILIAWGNIHQAVNAHSVRKSLLSALYGPAVQNEIIDLQATLKDLDIDDIPPSLIEGEKKATVQMLLQARSGVYHDAAYETESMAEKRPERYSHAPGTFWYYNNWDFNVLGYIYNEKTGKDIFEDFNDMIGRPIGMQDFNPQINGRYVYENEKSKYPAYPFYLSASDMARFGLLMLRKGRWKDLQIVTENWVAESTTSYSSAGSNGGYGYLWWVSVGNKNGLNNKQLPALYTAKGSRGHVITVLPGEDIVFVYQNDDAKSGKNTSYTEIGRVLELILDGKKNN